ncbi:MAG: type III pantothenate kinase [Phycisphaerae bacterium]|nr:type III pantothenate kinase [Phycisphaerae bacterium]
MNIIAIDIGNTNITAGLFIDNTETIMEKIGGGNSEELTACLKSFWQKIPFVKAGKEKDKKRDGVIVVGSVKPDWTEKVREIAKKELDEKILEIGVGKDVPLPMKLNVDEPGQVGVDRVLCAFAAYSVVEDAVIVADFGTAVTIDLVSAEGVFLGGTILPGFDISADALHRQTAALPKIDKVEIPKKPLGRNTIEAINNGLYYSAIGALETIGRLYSEEIGRWPQTVVTGGNMEIVKSGCEFADSFVTDLGVKGIVLAYEKFIGEKD